MQAQTASFVLPGPGVTAIDFGSRNVGSTSGSQTITFKFTSGGTLGTGAVEAVTEGVPGLDFKDTGTGTCNAPKTYAAGDTCTAVVQFAPTVPGLRAGAVWLKAQAGYVLATAFVHGFGIGPLAAFDPGTPMTILTGLEGSAPLSSLPLAVDAGGDVILPSGYEIPAAGGSHVYLQMVSAGPVVIDGAGNVFGLGSFSFRYHLGLFEQVLTSRRNGTSYNYGSPFTISTTEQVIPLFYVDGSGNFYQLNSDGVTEVPWNGNGYDPPVIVPTLPLQLIDQTSDGHGNTYSLLPSNSILKIDRSHPPALHFGTDLVGTTSVDSPKTFSLSNIGNTPLIFPTPVAGTNPSLSSDFTLGSSTTCPQIGSATSDASLVEGSTCQYAVKFIATVPGAIAGSLVITDNNLNAVAVTQAAPLTGTGLAKYRYISFSPQSANFGDIGIGTTSQPISITVTNGSGAAAGYLNFLNLSRFHIDGGTCGPVSPSTQLAAGASCTFSATFSPIAKVPTVGSFVVGNSSDRTTFQLKGNGVAPLLYAHPSALNFGDVGAGTTSLPLTITITNQTGSPATYLSSTGLSRFTFSGGSCAGIASSGTVPADSTCTASVTFSPAGQGPVSGSFTLSTINGPFTYHLSGNGVPATLVFSPSSANFGNVFVGSTSAPIAVTASNHTGSPVTYLSETGLQQFDLQGGSCGGVGPGVTLAPGASCTFMAEFMPTEFVTSSGSFTLNTSSGPVTFHLSGTGVPAVFSFSTGTVDFGSVPVGGSSSAVVTASNNSIYPVSVQLTPQGPFSFAPYTCGILAPGASCQFKVIFTPTSTAPAFATIGDAILGGPAGGYVLLDAQGNP
ncbi:MAG TPA: choice-of-anchor D domain-containing protein [Acidisarcina sp.]